MTAPRDVCSNGARWAQFRVVVALHPRAEGEARRLEALVDTGAGYTVMPRLVLEGLGCEPHRLQPVRFADGRVEEWPVAEVEVECEGRRATLEELGLGVDPINRGMSDTLRRIADLVQGQASRRG